MKKLIAKWNKALYDDGNYVEKTISTNADFIKYYQDFLDLVETDDESHTVFIKNYINKVKASKDLYVIDNLVNMAAGSDELNDGVFLFSTAEELNKEMSTYKLQTKEEFEAEMKTYLASDEHLRVLEVLEEVVNEVKELTVKQVKQLRIELDTIEEEDIIASLEVLKVYLRYAKG